MDSAFDVIVIVLVFLCSIMIAISGYPFMAFVLGTYGILRIAYSFLKLLD